MSAPPDVEHDIADHLCRWSRTGRDGACSKRRRVRSRGAQQRLSDVHGAVAIGLARRIVSPGQLDPCRLRRRSAIAAPTATTKSP